MKVILGSDQCRLLPFVLIKEKQKKREPHERITRRELLWAEKKAIREIRSVSAHAVYLSIPYELLKMSKEQVFATFHSPKADAEAGVMAAETTLFPTDP